MTQRYYSSTAVQTTGTAGINAVVTSMTVGSTAGWPTQYPFTLILDENTGTEELVDVTNVSGLTITVTRGVDGTSAQSHSVGFTVRHGFSGRDFRDSRTHEATSTGVHGITGAVVGDTDAQTLSTKTLASPLVTGTFPLHTHADGGTGGTLPSLTGHIAATSGVHGVAGTVVGTTDTQNLSNKTLVSGKATPADVNSKGLLVKALSSQVDNIAEVQLFDGTPKWWIAADGSVHAGSVVTLQAATLQPGIKAVAFDTATTPLVVQGVPGQTADLFEAKDPSLTTVFSVDQTGKATTAGLSVTGASTLSGGALVNAPDVSHAAVTAKGAAGQTANLQEWQTSTGTVVASVDKNGVLTANGQPYLMAAGTLDYVFGGGNTLSQTLAFPAGRFTVSPVVTVSIQSSPASSRPVTCRVTGISASAATGIVNSVDSSAMTGTWTLSWIAVQMTPSAAAG